MVLAFRWPLKVVLRVAFWTFIISCSCLSRSSWRLRNNSCKRRAALSLSSDLYQQGEEFISNTILSSKAQCKRTSKNAKQMRNTKWNCYSHSSASPRTINNLCLNSVLHRERDIHLVLHLDVSCVVIAHKVNRTSSKHQSVTPLVGNHVHNQVTW